MNKIESLVYGCVKNNYVIKTALRNLYQGFYDLLPDRESRFSRPPIVHENCFFGFHDCDPFSEDGSKVLSNRLTIPLRMPTEKDMLEVGYWAGERFSEWHKIGETVAWNYHKGCRLQWMPRQEHVIYNVFEQGALRSRISSLDGGETRLVSWPIDTVSHDGRWATSFSYGRLQSRMPGYGYVFGDEDAWLNEPVSRHTGLYLIDLLRDERKMLVDLATLQELYPDASMEGLTQFVTHTEFSYDNRYLAFLHRGYEGTRRVTRLMVYDLETDKIFVSPTSGMVSHFAWNRENGIVAYCRIEGIDSHVYFDTPEMDTWTRCAYPQINSDGHQHFVDADWFLTDTYPDRRRHSRLYKVNRRTGAVVLLADVKSPKEFVPPSDHEWWKCDLHPRCSADGRWISFDSIHTGVRSLCLMPNEGRLSAGGV